MTTPPLVGKNGVIKAATPVALTPPHTWVVVWPFAILYTIQTFLYNFPEVVWGKTTYLVYQMYIDFFHAIGFPFLIFIHAFLFLFTVWSVKFRVKIRFSILKNDQLREASHILVETHAHKGESTLVPLHVTKSDITFSYQQRKWKFNNDKKCFTKPHFPTKMMFSEYKASKGIVSDSMKYDSLDAFGFNELVIIIPEFKDLFVDHAFAPFFVFQMFCVLLWCLDEYWMYSIFTGFMMIVMECTVVFQRIRNLGTLRQMGMVPVTNVVAMRNGAWKSIKSTDLLPMDLILVSSNAPCPADAIIISGTCVVNEAMLTGESTPQMKEAVENMEDEQLEMKKHSRHMLYSGTEVLLSSGNTTAPGLVSKGSAIAVVLKTGFETKQGKLLRTIIHSQSRISENSGEAFGFIGVLLVFALAASGHLVKRGLEDPNRSKWKLFLTSIQIITAVVPPELPMELSLAVNTSLMALVKLSVFCTEPFRIPFAGKVDTCAFDKTGTLTTDEMLFAGIDACDNAGLLSQLRKIPRLTEYVLASCHSLVQLEGSALAGDAMEKASIGALGYKCAKEDVVTKDKDVAFQGSEAIRLTTVHRYPFIPALRRMSCVVNSGDGHFVFCKGAPETIKPLCKVIPKSFDDVCDSYTNKGFRVIALAYKRMDAGQTSRAAISSMSRAVAESDFIFGGLAIFQCPLKSDAIETIQNLQGGSHRCMIITGDNVHTAIAVAKEVTMSPCEVQVVAQANSKSGEIEWVCGRSHQVLFSAEEASATKMLSRTFVRAISNASRSGNEKTEGKVDLCVSADTLTTEQFNQVLKGFGHVISVWARCAPSQKEDIVSYLKNRGNIVLMAGDGTNDVGGLKQAHVGIAVLNSASVAANTEAHAKNVKEAKQQQVQEPGLPPIPPGFKLTPIPPPLPPNAGFMDTMKHQVAVARRTAEIQQLERLDKQKKKKNEEKAAVAASPTSSSSPAEATDPSDFLMKSMFNADDDDMGQMPMIKLGDASIAAPFTCKSKKLSSICDIVRLGRSTLVTTLQMYKILALNCLVSAYTMSVLHSDGVKLGDKQMMLTGVIISICFLCMSRTQPLSTLSVQRPITRVFHPYMVCSIAGQFALHLYSMIHAVNMVAHVDSEGLEAQRSEGEGVEFKPTLLNSIMFMMTTIMTCVTFAVNYRGEPFMQPMRKNKPMLYSLVALFFIIFYFACEMDPETNEYFEIVVFPSEEFRTEFLQLLATDIIGSFAVEKICLWAMTDY